MNKKYFGVHREGWKFFLIFSLLSLLSLTISKVLFLLFIIFSFFLLIDFIQPSKSADFHKINNSDNKQIQDLPWVKISDNKSAPNTPHIKQLAQVCVCLGPQASPLHIQPEQPPVTQKFDKLCPLT